MGTRRKSSGAAKMRTCWNTARWFMRSRISPALRSGENGPSSLASARRGCSRRWCWPAPACGLWYWSAGRMCRPGAGRWKPSAPGARWTRKTTCSSARAALGPFRTGSSTPARTTCASHGCWGSFTDTGPRNPCCTTRSPTSAPTCWSLWWRTSERRLSPSAGRSASGPGSPDWRLKTVPCGASAIWTPTAGAASPAGRPCSPSGIRRGTPLRRSCGRAYRWSASPLPWAYALSTGRRTLTLRSTAGRAVLYRRRTTACTCTCRTGPGCSPSACARAARSLRPLRKPAAWSRTG